MGFRCGYKWQLLAPASRKPALPLPARSSRIQTSLRLIQKLRIVISGAVDPAADRPRLEDGIARRT